MAMKAYSVIIIVLSISIGLFSCDQVENTNKINLPFQNPVIINEYVKDSVRGFQSTSLTEASPLFAGKYKFSDTFFIYKKRFFYSKNRNDLIVKSAALYSDSLQTDGFELIPDYSSNIFYNEYAGTYTYYPVYIVNQTPTTKKFTAKDNYTFGIQEALDTNGRWRPIEGKFFDFCGNGYWGMKVHSREFIAVLFPKYTGDYRTKIRVRIKIGNNIYVSKGFDGRINESQLYLKKDSYLYDALVENKASAITYLFYGAEPFGTDDKDFGLHAVWTE